MLASKIDGAYRGRFAPSPSGPLHFGSLVAAVGSYLDAKSQNGTWLVRIEDIDTPRVVKHSDTLILNTLENYGLTWDETIVYQSQSIERYQAALDQLVNNKAVYACQCTRKQIKEMGGIYQGICRDKGLNFTEQALRLKQSQTSHQFDDLFKGTILVDKCFTNEDYIIKRRDGIFAYQLVVVLDDIEQQISHIVRGADLLDPTIRQINLFQQLNKPVPQFGHLPLVVAKPGFKLSKQNHAAAINMEKPSPTLFAALQFLGLTPPSELAYEKVEIILKWACKHWQRANVPRNDEIQFIQHGDNAVFKAL